MSQYDPNRPYNALPDLPPEVDIETPAILKKCIPARVALAELKQACHRIPNQKVLINTIPVREARDSSAIENIVTTENSLFRHAAAKDAETDMATRETARYLQALMDGVHGISERRVSTSTAVTVCQIIRAIEVNIRNTPGTALRSSGSDKIIYTPPEGETILRDKLRSWETYLNQDSDVDPLIRMALAHYQFEAIHPFTDGNGRTGRILNILYLIDQGLLDIPVLYLSRYLIENRDDYYRLLLDVTARSEWEAWIIFMLSAVEQTAKHTIAKIFAIKALMDHTTDFISSVNSKIYKHELIELIFQNPICRIGYLTEAGLGTRQTVSGYLKGLCEIGVLVEEKFGREKIFLNIKLMKLLASDDNNFEPYGPSVTNDPSPN